MRGVAEVRVWDVARRESWFYPDLLGRAFAPRYAHMSVSACLAWAANSTMLAVGTGCLDTTDLSADTRWAEACGVPAKPCVMVWRLEPGVGLVFSSALEGPARWVTSVGWAPDGSAIVAGSSDGCIRVWRVGPPEPVEELFLQCVWSMLIVLCQVVHRCTGSSCEDCSRRREDRS